MGAAIQFPLGGPLRPRVTNKVHDKIKLDDKLAFFRQLTTLFRAGTPLYESLNIASEQTESKKLGAIVRDIAERISNGSSLSEAIEAHPEEFDSEWVFLIKSGEISGQLDDVLLRLATQIDEAAQFRSKVVSSLMYPAIVMCVSMGAVAVMLAFVVPTFAQMFKEMDKQLPDITLKVMAASDFLRESGHWVLGGAVAFWFGFKKWTSTPDGKRIWTRFLIGMPLFGDMMVQSSMQKFALNTAGLLQSGVPLLESIDAMKGIFRQNPIYQAAMKRIAQHIGRGGTLTEGMLVTGVFTKFMTNMTRIGEESGTMPEVFGEVAIFYRRRVETVATRIASNIETVLIIGMGLSVAIILIALYLPLFEMAT